MNKKRFLAIIMAVAMVFSATAFVTALAEDIDDEVIVDAAGGDEGSETEEVTEAAEEDEEEIEETTQATVGNSLLLVGPPTLPTIGFEPPIAEIPTEDDEEENTGTEIDDETIGKKWVQIHCDDGMSPGANRHYDVTFKFNGEVWWCTVNCLQCGLEVNFRFSNKSDLLQGNNPQIRCPGLGGATQPSNPTNPTGPTFENPTSEVPTVPTNPTGPTNELPVLPTNPTFQTPTNELPTIPATEPATAGPTEPVTEPVTEPATVPATEPATEAPTVAATTSTTATTPTAAPTVPVIITLPTEEVTEAETVEVNDDDPILAGPADGGDGAGTPDDPAAPTEMINVELPPTPLVQIGNTASWHLWNLILSLGGIALAVAMGIRAFAKKKKEDEQVDENPENRKKSLIMGLAIPVAAIAACIVFILTQDMTLPMAMVDQWTALHAALFAAGLACFIFADRKEKEKEEVKA